MSKRDLDFYVEFIPESYVGNISVTVKCKESEQYDLPYDIRCVLLDAVKRHQLFSGVDVHVM